MIKASPAGLKAALKVGNAFSVATEAAITDFYQTLPLRLDEARTRPLEGVSPDFVEGR